MSNLRWVARNVLAPAVFLVALAVVVWGRRDDLTPIFQDPGPTLVAIGVLVVLGHFINSTEFWVLYRAHGLPIGLWENWLLFTAGQLGNLIPGQVGTLYRFRYLKTVHGMAYARSGSSFGANLVITFASSSLAGLVGLAGTVASGGTVTWWIVAGFTTLGVAALAMVLRPLPKVSWLRGRPARLWQVFHEGWEDLRRRPAVAWQVLGLDLAKYVLVAIRFQLAFSLLGVDQPIWYFLVIAPAAGLAGAISFTPGGLGVRELFVTVAAVGVGSTIDDGLLAATVDRGVMLLASLVLGSVGYAVTRRRMQRVSVAEAPR